MKLLVALLIASSCALQGQGDPPAPTRIPVLAWGGPPSDQTTVERYRELAEAGFTHNFSGFSDLQAMSNALDVAALAGVKQFVTVPDLTGDPEKVVQRFKEHPALGGYYLRDEPAATDFPALGQLVKRIQAVDSTHECYINLFPNYANGTQLRSSNYQEYLDRFVAEVPVSLLSFDHYPVIGETLRSEWFENLEQVARAAAGAKKPFWAFALAVAHGPYPIPTLEQLRLQVFSNLAYGAQGIEYFTYWTSRSNEWNFHQGPIDADGRRTSVYDRVKRVNDEIRTLSGVFLDSRVVRLGHTGTAVPRGTRPYVIESPVTTLKTEGSGAVISLLENGNRRFLVIVNRDFRVAMPLVVRFERPGISERQKDGSAHQLDDALCTKTVEPGDLAVFQWEKRPADD